MALDHLLIGDIPSPRQHVLAQGFARHPHVLRERKYAGAKQQHVLVIGGEALREPGHRDAGIGRRAHTVWVPGMKGLMSEERLDVIAKRGRPRKEQRESVGEPAASHAAVIAAEGGDGHQVIGKIAIAPERSLEGDHLVNADSRLFVRELPGAANSQDQRPAGDVPAVDAEIAAGKHALFTSPQGPLKDCRRSPAPKLVAKDQPAGSLRQSKWTSTGAEVSSCG